MEPPAVIYWLPWWNLRLVLIPNDFYTKPSLEACHNAPTYELKAKRSSIQRYGQNSFGMKVNTPKVPETTMYTGLLAWGKGDCGKDFLEKVESGEVG